MTKKREKIIEFFRDTEIGQKIFMLILYMLFFSVVAYIMLFGFGIV